MNAEQREQVTNNARYLREVRPIDPEEITEYIDGHPHPAAIRQVLREQAVALGLLERDDGTFEPVSEGPVHVDFAGVAELPESIVRAVEELLVAAFGPGWPDGESGAQLRATIREFKAQYHERETVEYDELTALGYAIYHLPAYFATVQYVLSDLVADELVPSNLRILDVGAGVGGPALGIDHLLDEALIEYHAVEPSAAADILESIVEETGPDFHPTVHREPIEEYVPESKFDIVLFANVLSELDSPSKTVERALSWLSPDGSVVAISPADRNTAIGLRAIEREVERRAGATVYAPTVRLWPNEYPTSTSWSFDRKPDLELPSFQRRLDTGDRTPAETEPPEGADPPRMPGDGEFVNADVQYAYSILRRDGNRAIEFQASPARSSKFADSDRNMTKRIDCVAIKLSHDLSEGTNPLFLVGDGSEQVDHFAVLTESSALNQPLVAAGYGDLLRFENVLVLWNDDERAVNLVVDGETFVDRIPV